MKSLSRIMMLMLLPVFCMAQRHAIESIAPGKTVINSFPEAMRNNSVLSEKLRSVYFLIGARQDTFSFQNTWDASDSLQYLYSNDDSTLFEINHLINDVDSGWIKYQVNYYYYDAMLRDTAIILQTLDDQFIDYENTGKITYTYDANNNVISSTFYSWDTTYWESQTQFSNSYDTSNNLLETNILNWNGTSWDSANEFIYVYDTSNNLIQESDYYYDAGVLSFIPQFKYVPAYDSANLQIQKITQYWNGNAWKNQSKDTFEYDANNNVIYFERKDWKQSTMSYSLTNSKTEYVYNTENQLTERTDYNGDEASSYTPGAYYKYDFDSDGNNNYQLQQLYDVASSSFVNYNQFFYYYTDVLSGVGQVPNNAYVAKLFPNPATGTLQLMMQLNHGSDVKVQVADINGRLLSERSVSLIGGANKITVNVSDLAAGIYYLRIYNPITKAQSVNKFVKE